MHCRCSLLPQQQRLELATPSRQQARRTGAKQRRLDPDLHWPQESEQSEVLLQAEALVPLPWAAHQPSAHAALPLGARHRPLAGGPLLPTRQWTAQSLPQ